MQNNFSEQLFVNLDNWRHLPAYQLERRADILFSIYLPSFLEHRFKQQVQIVIPEFPIHIGTIYQKEINKSFKIDYVVKMHGNQVVFIELKTEMASRNEK